MGVRPARAVDDGARRKDIWPVGGRRVTHRLDLREPERLPTFGSRHFDEKVKDVATDGRFVYLRTSADEPDGRWHTFRATARSALEPAGNRPARSFAKNRKYAGRYAARLTGVALHVGVGSTP